MTACLHKLQPMGSPSSVHEHACPMPLHAHMLHRATCEAPPVMYSSCSSGGPSNLHAANGAVRP